MDQFLKKVCTFLIMEIIYIGLISWGILLVPSWFERGDLRFEKLSDNKKPSRPPSIIRTFWWGHKSENSCRVITRLIFSTTASKCIWRIIYANFYKLYFRHITQILTIQNYIIFIFLFTKTCKGKFVLYFCRHTLFKLMNCSGS